MDRIKENNKDGYMKNSWNQSDAHNIEIEKLKDIRKNLDGGWNRKGRAYLAEHDRIFGKGKSEK